MKRKFPIRLGVNIDHAATLRQVRGGITEYPNLLDLVKECKIAGASQITVHLREDRRHIQDQDVIDLCQKASLPINLEMAASSEMYEIAKDNKPDWICLVPEKRKELTTEGGLDVVRLKKQIQRLQQELLFSHRTRAQKGIEFNSREQGLEKGSKGGSQKS